MNIFGNGINLGRTPKPKVNVSIMLIYNADVFDLLTENKAKKLKFDNNVNGRLGSPTNGQVYQNIVDANLINIHSLADIKTVLRAAQ